METVGQTVGTVQEPSNGGGLIGAGKNLLDKVKTPVFWFAIGYVTSLIISRKKKYIKV